MSKNTYFLTFIDDYSRMYLIYFLKHKDKVFSYIKYFNNLVENQSGRNLKYLRTNHGGEFLSNNFLQYYKDNDIKRQLITAYNPQQIRVVERKNRTIL